ncbi:MAG: DUF3524 domain-containing protein [Desulfotignum sp.]|nr:DUF3524 domain-containing protein [Desulfotignum sp.]
MKVLFLEPFFGGSHQDFAEGFAANSRHEVTLLTLPPAFWKWRMRTASLVFLQKIKNLNAYDRVFATDMMNVSDFMAMAGPDRPPLVLYFHENQLSYPLSARARQRKPDVDLGMINITSALSADQVVFNSRFHLDAFVKQARQLIKQIPAPRPGKVVAQIQKKTRVVYPGCRFPSKPLPLTACPSDPPLIIWNHRWDYDKDPERFFRVLARLKKKGIAFSLAVLGEQYALYPEVFDQAKEMFAGEIRAFGFVSSRTAYQSMLAKGSVVVSTAIQENFGISVMEAVRFGCFPLLPRRLSYPELMPEQFHDDIFYQTDAQLLEKLTHHLTDPGACLHLRTRLSEHAGQFAWETQVNRYDRLLEEASVSPPLF